MEEIGAALGRSLAGGEVIALRGGLGSGKTAFCKGLARGLGVTDDVTSPTFPIVTVYEGRLRFAHFDAYRLGSADDLDDIGFVDYLESDTVCAIEWSERVEEALPPGRLVVEIAPRDDGTRLLSLSGPLSVAEDALDPERRPR